VRIGAREKRRERKDGHVVWLDVKNSMIVCWSGTRGFERQEVTRGQVVEPLSGGAGSHPQLHTTHQ